MRRRARPQLLQEGGLQLRQMHQQIAQHEGRFRFEQRTGRVHPYVVERKGHEQADPFGGIPTRGERCRQAVGELLLVEDRHRIHQVVLAREVAVQGPPRHTRRLTDLLHPESSDPTAPHQSERGTENPLHRGPVGSGAPGARSQLGLCGIDPDRREGCRAQPSFGHIRQIASDVSHQVGPGRERDPLVAWGVRIVSLLPSATEILFAVGAGAEVVGVTFECDFPPEARSRRIVSTTTLPDGLSSAQIDAVVRARMAAGEDLYTLDEGALRDLDPDLVVTQDLCAVCAVDIDEVDKALEHLGCRAEVLTLDPMTLDEVLSSIETIGRATATGKRATRARPVSPPEAGSNRPRRGHVEIVPVWPCSNGPILPFCAGHWVPDMVTAAGAVPVLGAAGTRSERIEWSTVAGEQPDIVVVAPCGYRLEGAVQLAEEVVRAGVLPPEVPVWAVDADAAFVRPGPRVVDGVETLAHIAHPDAIAALAGMSAPIRQRPAVRSAGLGPVQPAAPAGAATGV